MRLTKTEDNQDVEIYAMDGDIIVKVHPKSVIKGSVKYAHVQDLNEFQGNYYRFPSNEHAYGNVEELLDILQSRGFKVDKARERFLSWDRVTFTSLLNADAITYEKF